MGLTLNNTEDPAQDWIHFLDLQAPFMATDLRMASKPADSTFTIYVFRLAWVRSLLFHRLLPRAERSLDSLVSQGGETFRFISLEVQNATETAGDWKYVFWSQPSGYWSGCPTNTEPWLPISEAWPKVKGDRVEKPEAWSLSYSGSSKRSLPLT